MNYDNSQDAHKLSNYNWWREHHNFITDIEIDLSKLGVSQNKIRELHDKIIYCFKTNTAFALYEKSSTIIFIPEFLSSKQGDIRIKYQNQKQMINAVKLVLLAHHNIQIDGDYLQVSIKQKRLR